MRGVIPYLSLAGRAAEAADFYARAFAAVDLGRQPDPGHPGRFMHVQLAINGGCLMMTDHTGCGEDGAPQTVQHNGHLQLVVENGAAWWEHAVAAGCEVVQPYERQFWGDDWGLLRDPFGFHWAVLQAGAQPG
jgi:PhnB protein